MPSQQDNTKQLEAALYKVSDRVLSIEAMQDMLAEAERDLIGIKADFEAVRQHYREEWH